MTVKTEMICDGCGEVIKKHTHPITKDLFRPSHITTRQMFYDVDSGSEPRPSHEHVLHFHDASCVVRYFQEEESC